MKKIPIALLFLLTGLLQAADTPAEQLPLPGEKSYLEKCASCHGSRGQGVSGKYDETLYGDRPLAELTQIIIDTMPDEHPEQCVGEEAQQVAEFMYEMFYTAQARAKHEPPRVEMLHLTVPQYLNAVADVVGSFRGRSKVEETRGLRAEYFNDRSLRRDKRVIERTDPQVSFQFGEGSPDEKLETEQFAIGWEGGLLVDETGDYEFCVKSENGVQLFLNSSRNEEAFIDGWVASGGEVVEHKAQIKLLGGRCYPLRLEFFKFKDKSASIELLWKAPHKEWEVIPERHLTPSRVSETFVVTTPFPADDASLGYPRGSAVSRAWDEATTYAAIEVANHIINHLDRFAGWPKEKPEQERYIEFAQRFAERAFRRPLTAEIRDYFIGQQFSGDVDPKVALKLSLLRILKSPRFLYLELPDGETDSYDVASRLSFALWDSLPDEDLLKAASRNDLLKPEKVREQILRMESDPRVKLKINGFFAHLLQMEEADDVDKDAETFPGFDAQLLADMRTSLEMFLDEVMWSDGSDYRRLLLSNELYVNERIAAFYEIDLPEKGSSQFQRVSLDDSQRAGVVTHPFLLSALAYQKSTSPIHRGVFVTRRILGRALKPPPMAIAFMDSQFMPHLSMREKVAELTKSQTCQTCHSIINPLGFSLENYDAVGRFRTMEKEHPINAVSDYSTPDGETVRFQGARDLANYAVTSEMAHRGFVEQLFHHIVQQPVAAYDDETLTSLRQQFEQSEFHMRKLMQEITFIAATYQPPVETAVE